MKCLRQIDNDKLFINICQSDGIPPPDDITTDQLTDILKSDMASTFRVPMSISELRPIKDKSGRNATACDVAIHSKFFIKVERIELFRDFLLTIIFEAMATKYNVTVDQTNWTILKKKIMGELVPHRIQNRDVKQVIDSYETAKSMATCRPLVQEIGDSAAAAVATKRSKPLIEEIAMKDDGRRPMEYQMKVVDRQVVIEFFVPLVTSILEVFLVVGVDSIRFAAIKRGYFVDEYLPHRIDPERATAVFLTKTKVMIDN